jgi:hypothetical protein
MADQRKPPAREKEEPAPIPLDPDEPPRSVRKADRDDLVPQQEPDKDQGDALLDG